MRSSSDRIGFVLKLCLDSRELRAGKLALLMNDGDSLLMGRVKKTGDFGNRSSETSAFSAIDGRLKLDKNASRSVVKLSLFDSFVWTADDISVVVDGISVPSMRGSSVGSIILLFFRCGISTFVGFSFFELFKIEINFNGIALFVRFSCGAFVVVTDMIDAAAAAVVMLISSVDFGDVIDGRAVVVVAFLLSA